MGKLKAHVTTRRGELARLARAARVTEGAMSRIVHGERGASLAVAVAIEEATDGVITPADVAAAKINTRKAKKRPNGTARAGR